MDKYGPFSEAWNLVDLIREKIEEAKDYDSKELAEYIKAALDVSPTPVD